MAPKVIITKGLPGSGKSTWAKEQVLKGKGRVKRVNKDDLRALIDAGQEYMSSNEAFVLQCQAKIIAAAIRGNYHIIVDNTNLNPIHEIAIRKLAGPMVKVEVKDFTDVTPEECIRRDSKRENPVGAAVIHKMAKQWRGWKDVDCQVTFDEPVQYEFNPDLPYAIIVDIDGTLAHVTSRSYYDYSRVSTDAIDPIVQLLVQTMAQSHHIIIVSGRDALCYEDTSEWLKRYEIPFEMLIMRADDDKRHDYIVKKELYETHIKDRFNVRFVLDDRNQVVDQWRAMGLKCLQVANGDF